MKTLSKLGDRLLASFVPRAEARADDCAYEYRCVSGESGCTSNRKRQRRLLCVSHAGRWYDYGCC